MTRLHIELLLSKWTLTLKRHRAEIEEIEREIAEHAASFKKVREMLDRESIR